MADEDTVDTAERLAGRPGASVATFGVMPDGRAVQAVTLTNGSGAAATVLTFGATLQSVVVPDRDGRLDDVHPGFADLDGYLAKREFFGGTVGRYANRIADGRFALQERTFQLSVNDGVNTLHGGHEGFDRRLWDIVKIVDDPLPSVTMRLLSPDGDQGYPGDLTVGATFSLDASNRLDIAYGATCDSPTIVNITSHAYWILSGCDSTCGSMGNLLLVPAQTYLPTRPGAIPTGEMRPVEGSPFDFRTPRTIGDRVRDATDSQIVLGRGYDHDFVLADAPTTGERLLAILEDPVSGRGFELWSNQPGLQFYSGNFLDGTTVGKGSRIYRAGDAVVLEPQLHPDTPNRPDFGSAMLEPGATYRNVISYRFYTGSRLS